MPPAVAGYYAVLAVLLFSYCFTSKSTGYSHHRMLEFLFCLMGLIFEFGPLSQYEVGELFSSVPEKVLFLNIFFEQDFFYSVKVSKIAKIRNRCNRVPHLTQDTKGKVTNLQLDTTNESQEVSPFPASDNSFCC